MASSSRADFWSNKTDEELEVALEKNLTDKKKLEQEYNKSHDYNIGGAISSLNDEIFAIQAEIAKRNKPNSTDGRVDTKEAQDYENAKKDAFFDENGNYRLEVQNLIEAYGLQDRSRLGWTHRFNRTGIVDPYNTLTTTKEYLFFTKPDLPILYTGHNDPSTGIRLIHPMIADSPFFKGMEGAIGRHVDMASQLQSSTRGWSKYDNNPFMTVLSNTVTSELDLPDINGSGIETGSNYMGNRISYRGIGSGNTDFDFTLEFEDNKYLDVYMLFRMYEEFEKIKWEGYLDYTKDPTNHWTNYILNKILYDQISIYKFIVAEDGYRIIYWARITGCYPTSVPRSALGKIEGPQKLSIGWHGHFVRDMDPVILYQFNDIIRNYNKATENTSKGNRVSLPIYNIEAQHIDNRWAHCPYIATNQLDGSRYINRDKTSSGVAKYYRPKQEYYLCWTY